MKLLKFLPVVALVLGFGASSYAATPTTALSCKRARAKLSDAKNLRSASMKPYQAAKEEMIALFKSAELNYSFISQSTYGMENGLRYLEDRHRKLWTEYYILSHLHEVDVEEMDSAWQASVSLHQNRARFLEAMIEIDKLGIQDVIETLLTDPLSDGYRAEAGTLRRKFLALQAASLNYQRLWVELKEACPSGRR